MRREANRTKILKKQKLHQLGSDFSNPDTRSACLPKRQSYYAHF